MASSSDAGVVDVGDAVMHEKNLIWVLRGSRAGGVERRAPKLTYI